MILNLNNYKKLDRVVEKPTVLYENGESLLIAPSKVYIPQTWLSEREISEFAPFLIGCDKKSQHKLFVIFVQSYD